MNEIILQHNIDYYFKECEDKQLDEYSIEHIEKMIIEGYNQGELCQYDNELDEELRGWWKITKG